MMLAFSRGYGQAMAEALMEAGKAHGLRPCGESRFLDLLHGAAFQK
jgi:glycine cleavage system aminomethyltransferase T